MGESNVNVLQREVLLGQFLQAQNDGILGCVLDPGALGNKRSSDL
jgi:hypothetical protein